MVYGSRLINRKTFRKFDHSLEFFGKKVIFVYIRQKMSDAKVPIADALK